MKENSNVPENILFMTRSILILKVEVFYNLLHDSVFIILFDFELESDYKISEFLEIFLFANLWVYFDNNCVCTQEFYVLARVPGNLKIFEIRKFKIFET